MAPIRRYLRITKYSVLECRIYLDNPALAETWLLNPRKPVLPRVIESVRPLVLPKLREEKERSKKKGSKKKGIKDVIIEDDFEVSIFLTETTTRHSLLFKHKQFREKLPAKLTSNSKKLTEATNEAPIDVDEDDDAGGNVPGLRLEDSDDEPVVLNTIPDAAETNQRRTRQSKRHRGEPDEQDEDSDYEPPSGDGDPPAAIDLDADSDAEHQPPPHKRRRRPAIQEAEGEGAEEEDDSKKKLAMDVSYEGFAIYGLVLCLVVKKRVAQVQTIRFSAASAAASASGSKPSGQAVMENWISSTQMPVDAVEEDAG